MTTRSPIEQQLFKRIETEKASTIVVDQILDLIRRRRLKPGDKLPPETKLMELFGLGRSSVREAKNFLAAKHVISIKPGKGSFIRHIGPEVFDSHLISLLIAEDTLSDIYEVRGLMEVAAAAFAAERATPQDLSKLLKVVRTMAKKADRGLQVYKEGLRFHEVLIHATHNQVLAKLFKPVLSLLHEVQEPAYIKSSDPKKEFESHEDIYKSIRDRDPRRAKAVMVTHLQYVRSVTGQTLEASERKEVVTTAEV